MARAKGNDLAEIFGYAPDDTSEVARKQWKSQDCPFVGGQCIKHSHPQNGEVVVYGSCSALNRRTSGVEEVIICPQRLYADNYGVLRAIIRDATGADLPLLMADDFLSLKRRHKLPESFAVLFGKNSGKEIQLKRAESIELSLDWVMAVVVDRALKAIIPCEVQSMDTTGNYRDNWEAYSKERTKIPDSEHGINWANVWKRLIPQLILKGSISATSTLCVYGHYFVVPDIVYSRFERLVGEIENREAAGPGIMTVMTYGLGVPVPFGNMRTLDRIRTARVGTTDFAEAFASGKQLPLGTDLDRQVVGLLGDLSDSMFGK